MNISGDLIEIGPQHKDFSQVIEIDVNHFPRPWSRQNWSTLDWSHHFLLGHNGDDLQAFGLFFLPGEEEAAHLLKIWVRSNLRGSGLSDKFWKDCVRFLRTKNVKSIFLEVEASNSRAIHFYQKQGFSQLRLIPGYYSDGQAALSMLATM
jgi:ribosomal-protein-alanine N-acetyltransferase